MQGFVARKKRRHSVKSDPNEMERLLRVRDRINNRVKKVNETIEQFKKAYDSCNYTISITRAGPAREAERDRSKKFIKEKRWYEGQRDMLQNQAFKLDRLIFASEGIKDAQETVSNLKELNGMMKNLQDDMVGLIDVSDEIVESLLGGSHKATDHDIDEQ
ncbi:hypothetical protein L2E82_21487 [Cichorium intybus]|uniref:Uncharacterized protein n=1 Tax=Cichorium intybus TaxID=13427 RepID=A0ACB9DWN3_CICIN|nr:hypothetical protein L2E82_21487 [Cichorium intybus]